MKKNKLLIAIGAAVLIGIVSLLAYRAQNQSSSSDVVRIGAILPLTGAGSVAGNYVRDALVFAANRYNGVDVSLVVEDSKSNPKDAVLAYRKLVSDRNIKVIFLQMSSVINTILPISNRDDVLLIGIGSIEPIVDDKDKRKYLTDYLDATTQARIFVENSLSKQIVLYYLNDDYGLSIKKAMESKVAAEVKKEIRIKSYSFAQDSNAQDLVVATSIDNNATVVIAGYGSIMVDIVERLLQYGFNGRILCTPEFLVNSNLDRIKNAATDISVIGMPVLLGNVGNAFQDQYGRKPSVADMLAYNGIVCVLDVMRGLSDHNEISAKKIIEALSSSKSFDNAPAIKCVNGKCFVYDAFVEKVFKDER